MPAPCMLWVPAPWAPCVNQARTYRKVQSKQSSVWFYKKRPNHKMSRKQAMPKHLTRSRKSMLRRADMVTGVLRHITAAPWFGAKAQKIQVAAILPRHIDIELWRDIVSGNESVWPMHVQYSRQQLKPLSASTFRSLRKRIKAKRTWGKLGTGWADIPGAMYIPHPCKYTPIEIQQQVFLKLKIYDDSKYRGRDFRSVEQWWVWQKKLEQCKGRVEVEIIVRVSVLLRAFRLINLEYEERLAIGGCL